MSPWLLFLVGFVGGVAGAATVAFGATAWYALTETWWWRQVQTRWLGWLARRRHRRSGRV